MKPVRFCAVLRFELVIKFCKIICCDAHGEAGKSPMGKYLLFCPQLVRECFPRNLGKGFVWNLFNFPGNLTPSQLTLSLLSFDIVTQFYENLIPVECY